MARRQRYIFAEEPRRGRGFLIGLLITFLLLTAFLITVNFAMNHSVSYQNDLYVTIPDLPSALENRTILHLSDLNGATMGENHTALRKALSGRSFSCVVLSGNMVGSSGNAQPVVDLIGILPKDTPVYLLPGDSDPPLYALDATAGLSPYALWAQQLIDAGVTILDKPVPYAYGGGRIWFVPANLYEIDLDNRRENLQNLLDELNARVEPLNADELVKKRTYEYRLELVETTREAIASMRDTDVQIAVSSMPLTRSYIRSALASTNASQIFSYHHVSLVLAGGYCAGQWRLPGLGAVWAPELGFFPEDTLLAGLDYLNGIPQHISPGLGTSDLYPLLPFRIFNSPTATRIVLTTRMR